MLGFRYINVFFLIRRNILSRFRDMTHHTVKKTPIEGLGGVMRVPQIGHIPKSQKR